jgi:hypothetical protein
MSHRVTGCFVLAVILILGASCTRLGEPGPGEQKLALENLTRADSVPASWGKLVSVSSVPGQEKWALLWFQDDEGVIRILTYNVNDNYLSIQARIIKRD